MVNTTHLPVNRQHWCERSRGAALQASEQAHIASREGGALLLTPHARGGSDPPQRLHHMLGGGLTPPRGFTTC